MLASKRTRTTVGANAELVYVGEGLVPKNLPYRIKLNTSGNTIGRGNCNIYLDSQEQPSMVSKLHAEITFCPDNNAWCLQDLGSTNGTLHNSTSVKSVTNMAEGDEITFGGAKDVPLGSSGGMRKGVKSIYTYEIRSCECAGGEDGRKRKHMRW